MLNIRPVSDLRNKFTEIEETVKRGQPVYLTKNGYGDMVIMSMRTYEERLGMADIYAKLAEAEEDIRAGRISDAASSLSDIRAKYNV